MAVAGAMTTAYWLRIRNDDPTQVVADRTTYPSDKCDTPADAVAKVRQGEKATVQGSDMATFWRLWEQEAD